MTEYFRVTCRLGRKTKPVTYARVPAYSSAKILQGAAWKLGYFDVRIHKELVDDKEEPRD